MLVINQKGSIILMILLMISLTSMTSIILLQSGLSLKKQTTLHELKEKSQQILSTQSLNYIQNIYEGVDFTSLPNTFNTTHQIDGYEFTYSKLLYSDSIIDMPISGFSLNNDFQTQIINLESRATSSQVNSTESKIGLSCLYLTSGSISNEIAPSYPLDINQNSITDVRYQFDSDTGNIWQTTSETELLIYFEFGSTQTFSRPDFFVSEIKQEAKLAIVFVIQNSETALQTSVNTLYILFVENLFDPTGQSSINSSELIDLSTNPKFSINQRGYFLDLDTGQLISSAIVTYGYNIILATQSPELKPETGLIEYKNKLSKINLTNGNGISIQNLTIQNSTELLELTVTTTNTTEATFNTQYQSNLLIFPGECRQVFYHEG